MGPCSILGYFSSCGPLLVWGQGQVAPPAPPLGGPVYITKEINFSVRQYYGVGSKLTQYLGRENEKRATELYRISQSDCQTVKLRLCMLHNYP